MVFVKELEGRKMTVPVIFQFLCPARTAMENAPSGQKVEKRLKAFF